MNGRILAMDKTIHEQVQTLLPWFVIDKLTGEELELVNRHLHVCEECQSDFTWQCKLQATPPNDETELNVDSAYAKLLPRLIPTQAKAQRWSLSGVMSNFWQKNPGWIQLALAVQFVAIIGLTVLLASPTGNVAMYRALGSNMNTTGNMVVVFSPTISEQELRRILQHAGARIVDGPTVTDAYLLNVPEEKLDGSLRDLRGERAVVLAESLRSGGHP